MGKFDGYLICSDLDGTLAIQSELVEANLEPIRYFQENGGYFTICSGRNPEHMRRFSDQLVPNTYVVGFGGAKAVDLSTGDVLFQTVYTNRMKEIFREMVELSEGVPSVFFHFTGEPTFTGFTLAEYENQRDEILSRSISTAGIRFVDAEHGEKYSRLLREKFKDEPVEIVRSFHACLELISIHGSKQAASQRLKAALGAHTLICVGDYENDISMIEGADIGYAVGDGCDAVKAVADRITVPASEGTIRVIIADLEASLA